VSQPLLRRALFDWWVRPFEELRVRLRNLRAAGQSQVDEIHRLLAEREARRGQEAAEGEGERDPRATTPELDLRVRSAVIRDGSSSAASIRQEMAEIVSLLGLHRQLDRSSERAYEVVAAAERLLALVRGDGWLFAKRDILAPGGDLLTAIAGYRQRLDDAHTDLLQKATYLEGAVARHIKRYEVVKYVFVALLLAGPLVGLWAGYQHADRPLGEPIPVRYVPPPVVHALRVLEAGGELTAKDTQVESHPWGAGADPASRARLALAAVEGDLIWARGLCRRLEESGGSAGALDLRCREVLVGLRATAHELDALGSLAEHQAELRKRIVHEAKRDAEGDGRSQEASP